MKTVLFIVFSCVLLHVNAWVGIIKYNTRIPLKHDGHCYTDSHNIGALERKEERRIEGQCAIATCLENRDITLSGCGVVGVQPPCYIVAGNLSKPYPECCYEMKCPENKVSEAEDEDRLNSI